MLITQASIIELASLARQVGRRALQHASAFVNADCASSVVRNSNAASNSVSGCSDCGGRPPPATFNSIGPSDCSTISTLYPTNHQRAQHAHSMQFQPGFLSRLSDLACPGDGGRRGYATRRFPRRQQGSTDEPQASGPKVSTSAPWPWVDNSLPFVLPVWVDVVKPVPLSLKDAISQVKANVATSLNGPPGAQLSGRPRKKTSDSESVELTITFLIDPRKSDQILRGVFVLPHGTGKAVRVAVFASGKAAEEARALGADVLGDEALIQQIVTSGVDAINFDRLIATPEFAKPLAKAGRVLGPKGLMPNPKLGTLTDDVATALKEMRAGRVEFRVGKDKMLQVVVGKVNFSEQSLHENITALMACLLEQRPAAIPGSGIKGYISRIYLKSSHTPVVHVDLASFGQLAKDRQATPAKPATTAAPAAATADDAPPANRQGRAAKKTAQSEAGEETADRKQRLEGTDSS